MSGYDNISANTQWSEILTINALYGQLLSKPSDASVSGSWAGKHCLCQPKLNLIHHNQLMNTLMINANSETSSIDSYDDLNDLIEISKVNDQFTYTVTKDKSNIIAYSRNGSVDTIRSTITPSLKYDFYEITNNRYDYKVSGLDFSISKTNEMVHQIKEFLYYRYSSITEPLNGNTMDQLVYHLTI